MRQDIIDLIFNISKKNNAFDILENCLKEISRKELSDNIIEVGILPEMFAHDSSEEKLWAKLSDVILSHALNCLNIKSRVLGARGNSADVFGEAEGYTLVADAKTFRLSRTAKNQKDFKINALASWRGGNNYALLVAPLVQYPSRKSQIYLQAIEKNITLTSYTHIRFLLEYHKDHRLKEIWETGNKLKRKTNINEYQKSDKYWSELDKITCEVVGKELSYLKKFKKVEIEKTKEIGQEGIKYWENKIRQFNKLSKKEAVELLIKSEKIEAKIKTIQKIVNKEFDL